MELLACLKFSTLTVTFSIQSSIPSPQMKLKESVMPKIKMLRLLLLSCEYWGQKLMWMNEAVRHSKLPRDTTDSRVPQF